MQAAKTTGSVSQRDSSTFKFISALLVFMVLLSLALYINNIYRAFQTPSLPQDTVMIPQSTLEEKYGLRVNLVAVTGAGGFVDVRLKIVDGNKAKLLLADSKNFPALYTEKGFILSASEDTKAQKIEFNSDGNLFIMYPNSNNAVTQGSPVTILFGDSALEPIKAR
jgi:hypothetical protein